MVSGPPQQVPSPVRPVSAGASASTVYTSQGAPSGSFDPGLVLHGVTAGRRLLDLGGQAFTSQATGGLPDLFGGVDLDAEMVQGASDAGTPSLGASISTSLRAASAMAKLA